MLNLIKQCLIKFSLFQCLINTEKGHNLIPHLRPKLVHVVVLQGSGDLIPSCLLFTNSIDSYSVACQVDGRIAVERKGTNWKWSSKHCNSMGALMPTAKTEAEMAELIEELEDGEGRG